MGHPLARRPTSLGMTPGQPAPARCHVMVLGVCALSTIMACTPQPTSGSPASPTPSSPATEKEPIRSNIRNSSTPATTASPNAVPPPPSRSSAEPIGVDQPGGDTPAATPTTEAFTPAPFAPPFELTKAEGDGQWVAMGSAELSEPAAVEPHFIYRSTVHPNPKNRFISLDVVAIDARQTRLAWVVGKKDEGAARLWGQQQPGLIPADAQPRALAVFNGGFQARHGWWGMGSGGVELLKPKDFGCTLAITADGQLRLGTWKHLGLNHLELAAYRQTPPCLLENSSLNAQLKKGQTRQWAGHNPDRKTRRRSSVGLSEDGSVLYFAIGTEGGPLDLARGMNAVGASTAAQLDINWAWTRFLLVGRRDGLPRITSSLVEDPLVGKHEYFSRPSDRDFFYLVPSVP